MAASWITGQGVSSRSSHSAAAGRTTLSENPWTHSRMSSWSWESSIEKLESAEPAIASATCFSAVSVAAIRNRPGGS